MRTYDFAPLSRSSVGFDRLFDLINSNAQRLNGQETNFPPEITSHASTTIRTALRSRSQVSLPKSQHHRAAEPVGGGGPEEEQANTNICTAASARRALTSNLTWRTTSR